MQPEFASVSQERGHRQTCLDFSKKRFKSMDLFGESFNMKYDKS